MKVVSNSRSSSSLGAVHGDLVGVPLPVDPVDTGLDRNPLQHVNNQRGVMSRS
jgi:hypothetical protein